MSYTTLDQLNHYQGNSPWCYSVQRANSFSSDRPPQFSPDTSQNCTNDEKGYNTREEADNCCAQSTKGSWCMTSIGPHGYDPGDGICHGNNIACKWNSPPSPSPGPGPGPGPGPARLCPNTNPHPSREGPAWEPPLTAPYWACVPTADIDSKEFVAVHQSLIGQKPRRYYGACNDSKNPKNSCGFSCQDQYLSTAASWYSPTAKKAGRNLLQCVHRPEGDKNADNGIIRPACAEIWNWALEKERHYDPEEKSVDKKGSFCSNMGEGKGICPAEESPCKWGCTKNTLKCDKQLKLCENMSGVTCEKDEDCSPQKQCKSWQVPPSTDDPIWCNLSWEGENQTEAPAVVASNVFRFPTTLNASLFSDLTGQATPYAGKDWTDCSTDYKGPYGGTKNFTCGVACNWPPYDTNPGPPNKWSEPVTKPYCICSSGKPHGKFSQYNEPRDKLNSCDLECTGTCFSSEGGLCSDETHLPEQTYCKNCSHPVRAPGAPDYK